MRILNFGLGASAVNPSTLRGTRFIPRRAIVLRFLIATLATIWAASNAQAKIGETAPQLVRRFGKHYSVEDLPVGKKYKFRAKNFSADATVVGGVCVAETYFSDHPLTTTGEPPVTIVRKILNTNAPKATWVEIKLEGLPIQSDYALRTPDNKYIATLSYTGPQPEKAIWTMTVMRAERPRNVPGRPVYHPANVDPPPPTGTGSGFFVSANGYAVTSYHVVEGAREIAVMQDRARWPATLVASDRANDIAVLKVDIASNPLPLGNPNNVVLGESVMTIGYPNVQVQGVSPKLTRGEINSLRGMQDDPRLFQVSVPIQPGNSGGPLIDESGNVIGITSGSLNALGMLGWEGVIPQNVNYAVKISYARLLLEDIPELRNQLPQPKPAKREPHEVVTEVQKATALVLVWK